VIAREAVLNDPEVQKLLRSHFVPLAVDNVANPDITPRDKEFLSSFDSGIKASTLGFSVFTAGGRKLGSAYDFRPGPIRDMLKKALLDFKPDEGPLPVKDGAPDSDSIRPPPEGGLILYVTWKTLGDDKPEGSPTTGDGKYDKVFQDSLGSDRLWVRKDEALRLARGEFPESLGRRIARFHLRYVLGGDGKSFDVASKAGKWEGSFSPDGSGPPASVLGHVEAKGGQITRFDLLIKGWAKRLEDHGFSANLSVVPKGKSVPAALYFELADPSEGLARVLPRRSNDESYLK
jgi:hypothetical protein